MIALNPVPGIPWVAVSFPFDPQLIALVKQVPGRKWDQKTRRWYFPHNLENIATFLATLPSDIAVSVHPALHHAIAERTADIAAAQAAKRNGDSNMAFDYLTAPYAHQRAGLELLSRLGSGALLWEMGLGKTKTAIDYAEWLCHNALVQHELEHGCGEVRETGQSRAKSLRSGMASHASRPASGLGEEISGDRESSIAAAPSLRNEGAISTSRSNVGMVRESASPTGQSVRDLPDGFRGRKAVNAEAAYRPQSLNGTGSGSPLWSMQSGTRADERRSDTALCGWRVPFAVLTVTPKTVARNWAAEIEKHAGHRDYAVLADGSLAKRAKQLAIARYTIVNPEALSLVPLSSAIIKQPWDIVIVDESTRFKTPGARRTKNLHKLHATRRVILTGTPITGKPEDAWSQFEFVAPGLFGSWWAYADRYLVKDYWKRIVGVKPEMIGELRDRIEQHSYRVLKSAVLDLPPKVYADRRVELVGEQRQAYEQMRKQLVIEMTDMPRVSAATILTQLLRLTQITAGLVGEGDRYRWLPDGAKVAELDDLLLDELAGEQVVVFGIYQRELEELASRYEGYTRQDDRLPIIYGPTPEKRRHELVEQFQAGSRRLLFVQEHTGGFGINLTAAHTAIYTTRSWSLEDWLQSQDRLHRIGQQGTVAVISLIANGTVDEQIAETLTDKAELADKLTGDQARRLAAQVLGERP